eukprot:gene24-9622_t
MKRALNANLKLLEALFDLLIDSFKKQHPEALRPLEELSRQLIASCETGNDESMQMVQTAVTDHVKSDDFFHQMAMFAECKEAKSSDFKFACVDHALEQENRRMKVSGGAKGLRQSHKQLTQFCLTAPELARLSAKIDCVSGMIKSYCKEHHDISPKILLRQEDNRRKLRETLSLSNPFTESHDLHNIMTKSVMAEAVSEDVFSSADRGREASEDFITKRIKGNQDLALNSIWKKQYQLMNFHVFHARYLMLQNGVKCSDGRHPITHLKTSQEEADTILLLHAIGVASIGAAIHNLLQDTDILFLALKYQPMLEDEAVFKTKGGKREAVQLKPIHDAIGTETSTAFPSFHAFTDCATVG